MRRIELPEDRTDPHYPAPIEVPSDDPTRIAGSPGADPRVRLLLDRISEQIEEVRPLAARSAEASERSAGSLGELLFAARILIVGSALLAGTLGLAGAVGLLVWIALQR